MAENDIAIRVDASVDIGSGHVMRCLALAKALAAFGRKCHFICRDLPGHLGTFIAASGYEVHLLPAPASASGVQPTDPAHAEWLGVDWGVDAQQSANVILRVAPGWVIVDHYALDQKWESAALPQGCKLFVLDDLADRAHTCDLLLDQTFARQARDYSDLVPARCHVLAGAPHALLRPEFGAARKESLARRRATAHRRLHVSMGGYDKDNATCRVMQALLVSSDTTDVAQMDVVISSKAPHLLEVRALASAMPWPTTVHVDSTDMAMLLSAADLAIGAAGTSVWERCCLGVPSLMLLLADNQEHVGTILDLKGAAILLGRLSDKGWESKLVTAMTELRAPEAITELAERAAAVTDGNGTRRVIDALIEAELSVRPADLADAVRVWEWRHAVDAFKYNRDPAPTSLIDHLAWFEGAIASNTRLMLIVHRGEEPIGYVRFDLDAGAPGQATVSICLSPECRGKRLSGPALSISLKAALERGIETIKAEVNEANAPSKRLFEAHRFTLKKQDGPFLQYWLGMESKHSEGVTKNPR